MRLIDLHAGRPLTRGALTVVPLWSSTAAHETGYDLGGDGLVVDERPDGPVVEELVVSNTGPRPALVLEGELLVGGHQHRVAARSVLVAPQAPTALEVRCVEAGRWRGTTRHARSGERAPLAVRTARDQRATWERIGELGARYDTSATSSLLESTGRARLRARRTIADLRPLPFQTGVLLCLAGHPVHLEAYDTPSSLAAVWRGLLDSVALDALALAPVPTPGRRVRRFLDRACDAGNGPLSGRQAGLATALSGATPYAEVDLLLWGERPIVVTATNPRHELVLA